MNTTVTPARCGAANVVVIVGTIIGEPTETELPAGTSVVNFDVASDVADGPRLVAPVAVHEPTADQRRVAAEGQPVVVIGSVRRRFFRSGGVTQSRTEVVADHVLPQRRRKAVESALVPILRTLRT